MLYYFIKFSFLISILLIASFERYLLITDIIFISFLFILYLSFYVKNFYLEKDFEIEGQDLI